MRRLIRHLLWALPIPFILTVLWVIGVIVGLPLIPWTETDYYIVGTNQKLANGYTLKQTDSVIVKIEIPDEFSENNQCFDFSFLATSGKHILSVKNFSHTLFDNDNLEIKKQNSYLFSDNRSKKEVFDIDNYEIVHSEDYNQKKYVFFRTVFNTQGISNFSIKLKTTFFIDNQSNVIDTTLQVEKKHRLTWNSFRLH